ncbi:MULTISPECIES: hypothetical protein [unclassified Achromobacter]|nr:MULTISPECIES: hypothetical protein [unclassified Achromobacter]
MKRLLCAMVLAGAATLAAGCAHVTDRYQAGVRDVGLGPCS